MMNLLRGVVIGLSLQLIIAKSDYSKMALVVFFYTLIITAYYNWRDYKKENEIKLDFDSLLLIIYNNGYYFSDSKEHKNCYVIEFDEIYDQKKLDSLRLLINFRLRNTNHKIHALAVNDVMKRFEITISKPHLN